MESNLSFLITNIVILVLQFSGIILNGFILFMFIRSKSLRRNNAVQLLFFLTITDFLHALTTLPYISYMTALWHPFRINLNPYFVMISSTPLVIQLKVNLTLTIAIATERTLALFHPLLYRKVSSATYSLTSLLIGIAFACNDLFLEFLLSPIVAHRNCAAIGCFVSDDFRFYWGTSNMIMGLFVIVLTMMVLFKLRSIQNNSKDTGSTVGKGTSKLSQANRTSLGILLTSLLFVTLPSVGVGFVEMIGFSIFKTVGPFYIVGLLCAGACNSIVYVVLNRDMRRLAKNCLTGRGASLVSPSTRVEVTNFRSTAII
ncbi:hypothetical protein NECAME_13435 [Necator americanus]|uniref:G-protein coupled receptors family 1 profile domain-containing protein n=1 Tax=Necator americanus TaxID=51031 RepID=W2SWB1_NECAM|nr:hypothetical protein NECAME_13435 [Necator americanus]ETN73783.1 hypothetical protein NECAME_13435 [Necator americanus]